MAEFGQLLFLDGRKGCLAMLGAYVDDSGSVDGHTYVLAAFFTTPGEWKSLMREWMGMVCRYGVTAFHATDCANGADEFEGWSKARKKRMFTNLVNILTRRSNVRGCSAGILCKDYEAVVYPEAHALFGGPQLLVFQLLLLEICKLAGERVAFIMDKPPKGWGKVDEIFDRTKSEATLTWRHYLHSLTPGNIHTFPAIQTADLLAYETYRQLSQKSGMVKKRRMRRSLWRLIVEKSLLRGKYLDRAAILSLIDQCKRAGRLAA